MTLDFVRTDLSRIFEKGQTYVALSRATTLQGLWLEGKTSEIGRKTGVDPEVLDFFMRTIWLNGGPPELAQHFQFLVLGVDGSLMRNLGTCPSDLKAVELTNRRNAWGTG